MCVCKGRTLHCVMQISRQTWAKLIEAVVSGRLNWAAVIVSVLCMIFLVLIRLVNKQLWRFPKYKKLPIPIPSQLIAVSQLMSVYTYLHKGFQEINYGVYYNILFAHNVRKTFNIKVLLHKNEAII